jgi:symplekin
MSHLYKIALGWLCKAKTITDNMEAVWSAVLSIKDVILSLLDSDNDGMRTHAVKFMEMIVITQTHSGKLDVPRSYLDIVWPVLNFEPQG